jgi:hypothetical protein
MPIIVNKYLVAERLTAHDKARRAKRPQSSDLARDLVWCDIDFRERALSIYAPYFTCATGQRDNCPRRSAKREKRPPSEL